MRDDRPSTTAALVAAARGVAGVDPHAATLLGGRAGAMVRGMAAPWAAPLRLAADLASGGLVRHLRLRTQAIDAAVARACEAGARQVVLLGVGLDSRPWRLDCLRDRAVFEVDHPATASHRAQRTAHLSAPRAGRRVAVAMDFGRADLATTLRDAGLDPALPSVWVWEGVTMYLPPQATEATLAAMAALAAPGSTICLTYMTPVPALTPLARRALHAGFGALDEPLLGLYERAAMAQLLDVHGFDVIDDGSGRAWAATARAATGAEIRPPWAFSPERLAIAIRKGRGLPEGLDSRPDRIP